MPSLLPPDRLVGTGPLDHADWNYRPLLGWIQRLRFRLAAALLPERVGRLLEIGYGSGIFMPELAARSEVLVGIDVHPCGNRVSQHLRQHRVQAELVRGSADAMPFESRSFDAVVAISALSFVPYLDLAAREISRIMTPNGVLVVVVPGHSPLVDAGFRALTGVDPERDFQGRRQQVVAILSQHFSVSVRLPAPRLGPVRLYDAIRMTPA